MATLDITQDIEGGEAPLVKEIQNLEATLSTQLKAIADGLQKINVTVNLTGVQAPPATGGTQPPATGGGTTTGTGTTIPTNPNAYAMIGTAKFPNFSTAVAAAKDNDTIEIYGQILNDSAAVIANNVTVIGKTSDAGFKWTLGQSVRMAWGKGFIVAEGATLTVKNLEFQGMTVNGSNGSGIRMDPSCSNLVVDACYFHDGDEGILTSTAQGTVTITNSKFERLGSNGLSHGIYINAACDLLTVTNCTFLSMILGHGIKSRAQKSVITGCTVADMDGTSSYSISFPNGGDAEVSNCVIEQGQHNNNDNILTFGEEGMVNKVMSYKFHNNVVINDYTTGYLFLFPAQVTQAMVDIHDNQIVGPFATYMPNGLSWGANNQTLANRQAAGIAAYPALPAVK